MERSELKLSNIPTPEELYALERAARAARAGEVARLLRAAFDAVRNSFTREDRGLHHA